MIKVTTYEIIKWDLADSEGTVSSPSAIASMFSDDPGIDWDTEQMWVIGMNIKNDVHLKHLVSKGTYNSTICTPADIFVPILRLNLRRLILVHNHPSGCVDPSDEDMAFTKKVSKSCELLGLSLLDHVIITNKENYSFKREGLL